MGWEALGRAVVDRRVELGYVTRQAFADASRISVRTLGDIESARRTSYARDTLARLEQALLWPTGKVDALLCESPAPLPEGHETGGWIGDDWELMSRLIASGLSRDTVLRLVEVVRARRAKQQAELVEEVRRLVAEAGGDLDNAPDPDDDEPERLPPRPRTIEQSADNAPHLYLDPGESVRHQ